MMDLFYQGGPLFMGLLSLLLLCILILSVRTFMSIDNDKGSTSSYFYWIKELGTLALVLGIFGQLIGFFSAFSVIEQSDGMSPQVLAGGLKVSLITTLYGLLIFIVRSIILMVFKKKN